MSNMYELVSFMYLWLKIYGLQDIKKLTTVVVWTDCKQRGTYTCMNMSKEEKIVIASALICQVLVICAIIILGNMYFPIPDWIMKIYAGGMITVFIVIIRHHSMKKQRLFFNENYRTKQGEYEDNYEKVHYTFYYLVNRIINQYVCFGVYIGIA